MSEQTEPKIESEVARQKLDEIQNMMLKSQSRIYEIRALVEGVEDGGKLLGEIDSAITGIKTSVDQLREKIS